MPQIALAYGLAVLLSATEATPPVAVPVVTPVFSTLTNGPAFFIECRNDSGKPLSSADVRWVSELRIDGRVLPEDGGRIGPGLTSLVGAGETWRGIIVLRPLNTEHFPAVKFGALVRITRQVGVNDGRHTFAVRCGEVWSEEVPFFWEAEK